MTANASFGWTLSIWFIRTVRAFCVCKRSAMMMLAFVRRHLWNSFHIFADPYIHTSNTFSRARIHKYVRLAFDWCDRAIYVCAIPDNAHKHTHNTLCVKTSTHSVCIRFFCALVGIRSYLAAIEISQSNVFVAVRFNWLRMTTRAFFLNWINYWNNRENIIFLDEKNDHRCARNTICICCIRSHKSNRYPTALHDHDERTAIRSFVQMCVR